MKCGCQVPLIRKASFGLRSETTKTSSLDMRMVIWDQVKKTYLTYCSASTAVVSRRLDCEDRGKARANFTPQAVPSDQKRGDIVSQKVQLICCV